MTPITFTSPAAAPNTMIAIPAPHPARRRTGPLRSGHPRGNPNRAPRCGAKARTTGCPCRAEPAPAEALGDSDISKHGNKSMAYNLPIGGRSSLHPQSLGRKRCRQELAPFRC